LAVYQRGKIWWYQFTYAGRRVQESAKTTSKTIAREAERKRHRELESRFNAIDERPKDRMRSLSDLAVSYLKEYKLKHKAVAFAEYTVGHVLRHLGEKMLVEIGDKGIRTYQIARLEEKAAPKSINEEVGFLLRIMGERGDLLRSELRRQKSLKLKVSAQPGKAFSVAEKDAMISAAELSRSPLILPALTLALNAGMRDGEIRGTRWSQVDFDKAILTVGQSKTAAGEGRTIPLNKEILEALLNHARWYVSNFGELRPEWYVFPFGRRGGMDPTKPITTLKTAWKTVRRRALVTGRWHDTRHTLITELAEGGAGDQTIMDIAGHVSRQMLARYSHIRTEAKRNALEDVLKRRQKDRDLRSKSPR
jgi:integrase